MGLFKRALGFDGKIARLPAADGIFDMAQLESLQEQLVRGQISLDDLQGKLR